MPSTHPRPAPSRVTPAIIAMAATLFLIPENCLSDPVFEESEDPSGIDPVQEWQDLSSALESNPIDLNAADRPTLAGIPGISNTEAGLLVRRRSLEGPFTSTSDAASTVGITPIAAQALIRFGMVAQPDIPWHTAAGLAVAWNSSVLDSRTTAMKAPDSTIFVSAGWLESWRAWAAVTERPGATSVHGQEGRLVAAGPSPVFDPAAFGLSWHSSRISVTVGTFRVGFCTGLVMDNTGLERPDGHYPVRSAEMTSSEGSIRTPRRFSGAAVSFVVPAGNGWSVSGTAFFSYRFMDPVRQEVTWDRCPESGKECSDSEKLPFITWSHPEADGESTSYVVLTNSMREAVAGASVAFGRQDWRIHATGWASGIRFRPDVPGIRQSASSPLPENGRVFGAAGLGATVTLPMQGDLAVEAAFTGQGDAAAVAGAVFSPVKGLDLEPSFRYYSRNWDNPFTGSLSDSREFRGNRARDEIGARIDVTWRSSRYTQNRFRVDAARHGPDDLPESRPQIAFEAASLLTVYASRHERLAFEIAWRDRDLRTSGRGLSWDQYSSSSAGNLSGGCRTDWTASFGTSRLRRSSFSIWVSQSFLDAATLQNTFDMNMSAGTRIAADLSPGPALTAFFRWADESMIDDPSTTASQRCNGGETLASLPGICRGPATIQTGLALEQIVPVRGGMIRFKLWGRYTRHVDERLSWETGSSALGRNGVSAAFLMDFTLSGAVQSDRKNQTGGNR